MGKFSSLYHSPCQIGRTCTINIKNVQGTTLCFAVSGLGVNANKRTLEEAVIRGKKEGGLTNSYDIEVNASVLNGLGVFNYNHIYDVDGTCPADLTRGMVQGRKLAHELATYYRYNFPGAENAAVVNTASMLGVRESRRIVGDYKLSKEDYINRVKHYDDIAYNNYPTDIHVNGNSENGYKKMYEMYNNSFYSTGEFYGIPYRSLLPQGVSNAYIVGRSISCDRIMQSSVRVAPACISMGQAAGTAASLVTEGCNVRNIDIKELQSKLKDADVFLEN